MNWKLIYRVRDKLFASKALLFFCAFAMLMISIQAQQKSISYEEVKDVENFGRFRYLEVKGHTGFHLYAGDLLNDAVDQGYGSMEFRYAWQPKDPEHWTSRYGYSSYGVGYYSGFVGNPKVLGKPNAIFGFLNFPLTKSFRKNVLELSPSAGVTFNLEPYNPESNPDNDAIGSPVALYFNLSLGGAYKLTREMDVLYGIDYTHFSNGRVTTPNYGLNMYGLNLGLRYHYNTDQKFVDKDPYSNKVLQSRFKRPEAEKSEKIKENSIEVYLGLGTVQNEEDKGTYKRYGIFSGVLDYRFKFTTMHAVTAGFDLFYDNSLEPEYPETADQFLTGVHIGYDFMFGKMAVRLQAGTYLGDDKGKKPTYLRAGFRYDINSWLFAQIAVKTKNTSRADWAEAGIGFTPFKW